jgi:hypothetical protein
MSTQKRFYFKKKYYLKFENFKFKIKNHKKKI